VRFEVRVVEPSSPTFDDDLFALVHELCDDARLDDHSPRYLLAIPDHDRVERVRCMVNALGAGLWDEKSGQLRLRNGQFIVVRSRPLDAWPFERAVVVCSRDFPNERDVDALLECVSVVLVFDPDDPPTAGVRLRAMEKFAASGG
jgi:hypothetical protein